MDTEKCRALLFVLERGSLSAAAEALGYTLSGMSRMIASLEGELGFPLLLRSRGGTEPTEECLALLPDFRELAYWAEHCRQLCAEICHLETGVVTVGTAYSAYFQWVAELMAEFKRAYPQVELRVRQGNSSKLSAAMKERGVDLCIISYREGGQGWIPLASDPMVALLPAGHPLAGGAAFPVKAFASEPFIDLFPGEDTDKTRLLAKHRINPNVQFSCTDSGAAYAMVEAGLGVSVDNALVAGRWKGTVQLRPLDPPERVDIGVAYPLDDSLSPAAKKFIAFAKSRAGRADRGFGPGAVN